MNRFDSIKLAYIDEKPSQNNVKHNYICLQRTKAIFRF